MAKKLTHIDEAGRASMVDVSGKPAMAREATASAQIRLASETIATLASGEAPKGDVLAVARIAGIQGAKRCQDLIPLCHQLPLSKVAVDFNFDESGLTIECTAKTIAQTGVEMEALTGASIAALTVYDMCKAIDDSMVVQEVKLLRKSKHEIL